MELSIEENSGVAVCPVCMGKGFVPSGFYDSTDIIWTTTTTGKETCRSCLGKGYVVI